jgi:NADH:ubiquinone oxidoreductase subunit B-like Fe-S oxidoreductase
MPVPVAALSSATRLLRLWVVDVNVVCCQVEVSATD